MVKRVIFLSVVVSVQLVFVNCSHSADSEGVLSWRLKIKQPAIIVPFAKQQITSLAAIPDELQDGLTYLNEQRTAAGLIQYSANTLLNESAGNHVAYLVTNNLFGHYEDESKYPTGFTGSTPTDRAGYAGYESSVSENLSAGNSTVEESIDSLFSAIYHRFGFLSFSTDEIGIGVETSGSYGYNSAYGYNMGASQINALCSGTSYTGGGGYYWGVCTDSNFKIEIETYKEARDTNLRANPAIVLWPYENQPDSIPAFYEESPDPLPTCSVSGYPVSIQLNELQTGTVEMTSFKLYDGVNREIVDTVVLTEETDPNSRFSSYEFALFPLQRLDWGKNYSVDFQYTEDGAPKNVTWSYKTEELQYPYYNVVNENDLNVVSDVVYGFYFSPASCNDTITDYSISYDSGLSISQSGFVDGNTLYFQLSGTDGLSMKVTANKSEGESVVYTVTLASSGSAILKGDVNGDGEAELADIILGLQISAGQSVSGINFNGDANEDEKIDLVETLHVLKSLSKS